MSVVSSVLSLVLGRPLASSEKEEVRIGVGAGVPAMGLDGLTSSAYGPEAALTILMPLGVAGVGWLVPITGVILVLLGMLYFSYRQTIEAYPANGGSYTVARENLGVWVGLLAASALMIDYVLNVAVGISAGVAALVSAAPSLHEYTLPLCLGVLVVITLMNLRGTGEAGLAFAVPTYLFVATLMAVLAIGVGKAVMGGGHPAAVVRPPVVSAGVEAVGVWILLRSFASGCTAMTGVEAVSNGVGAFREPTVRNARRTLTVIVVILAVLLGGIAYLARAYGVGAMVQDRAGYQSVLSQLTQAVVGRGWFYYVTIGSVLATLCLSANTSFVGFPRLCRQIAADDFLPRGFAVVGRRLVYSVGILFLAGAAGALLVVFGGITDRLIPLFAVGAFGAFTLSQAGMVMHWRKELRRGREEGEPRRREGREGGREEEGRGGCERQDAKDAKEETQRSGVEECLARGVGKRGGGRGVHVRLWVNGVGAVATGVALGVILAAKFVEGAWIVVIAIPVLLGLFRGVKGHYERVESQVRARHALDLSHNQPPVVLVPIGRWDRLTGKALRFSMWLSSDVIGVHLNNLSGEEAEEVEERVRREWAEDVEGPAREHGVPVPRLEVVQSPYRSFLNPLLGEIDKLKREHPGRLIAVVIPEVVEMRWWDHLLHTRKPARLRAALLKRGDRRVVVVNVPWYVEE